MLCLFLLRSLIKPRKKFPLVYLLVAVTSSGILKAKQKLGVTFNSDHVQCLGGGLDIDSSKNLVCKVWQKIKICY